MLCCVYCKSDLNISGGGSNGVNRHALGKKHKELANAVKHSQSITEFVSRDKSLDEVRII